MSSLRIKSTPFATQKILCLLLGTTISISLKTAELIKIALLPLVGHTKHLMDSLKTNAKVTLEVESTTSR